MAVSTFTFSSRGKTTLDESQVSWFLSTDTFTRPAGQIVFVSLTGSIDGYSSSDSLTGDSYSFSDSTCYFNEDKSSIEPQILNFSNLNNVSSAVYVLLIRNSLLPNVYSNSYYSFNAVLKIYTKDPSSQANAFLGTQEFKSGFLGTTSLSEIHIGSSLVWSKPLTITLDTNGLTLEAGKTYFVNCTINKNADIYWSPISQEHVFTSYERGGQSNFIDVGIIVEDVLDSKSGTIIFTAITSYGEKVEVSLPWITSI